MFSIGHLIFLISLSPEEGGSDALYGKISVDDSLDNFLHDWVYVYMVTFYYNNSGIF